jgi:hypothetical protein
MVIIHRPGQPDEIISASEFRRRARETEQQEADQSQGADAPLVDAEVTCARSVTVARGAVAC